MTAAAWRKDYVATLDGLRACAVLLVMWQHVPGWTQTLVGYNCLAALFGEEFARAHPVQVDWLRDDVFVAGYLGVDLFFVLSGFLITRILLVDRQRGVPLTHFLMRRFLRIFPIYYLTLGVVWLVAPEPDLPWCFFYLSNFHYMCAPGGVMQHSWSLAVEEHFYLVWPLVVYAGSTAVSRRVAACGMIPAAILCAAAAAWWWPDDRARVMQWTQLGTMFRAGSLACGALLACHEAFVRADPRRTLRIAVGLLVGGSALRLALPAGLVGSWSGVVRLVGLGLVSTSLVMVGIALEGGSGVLARSLRSAPLRFVGRISYGLYLYHHVVFHWIGLYQVPADLTQHHAASLVAAGFAVTFALATVSYYAIERPCLRVARRFRS